MFFIAKCNIFAPDYIITVITTNKNNAQMKTANKQLQEWYSSLPRNQFQRIREEIIEQCGITRAIFYNWLQGITPIPCHLYAVINQIASKEILSQETN